MLFNSYAFLLVFLPAALALHALVERFQPSWRLPLLLVLSILFYGYWDWRFIPLIILSIVINWAIATLFASTRRESLIVIAITANLFVLALFKYADFFAGLTNMLPGVSIPMLSLALPLGISFFTFHHVMYLTDLRAGKTKPFDLVRYGLYIAFFPQVLAGPLVRWSEIMHQFDERPYQRSDAAERFARGIMLLIVGLAKKVLIGDQLAVNVNPVFAAAELGSVTVAQAWQGTLSFTFQIYFDFSGYTDMALGIALMFGVVLPQNFDTPYRALSLQDFWRRWHMTLSRFLRDYLYIALGGNRHGLALQLLALFATMTLGGLWHGAGMTFVAWGVAHGVGLGVCVLWRRAGLSMHPIIGWFLTFLFVVLTWVLFRAESFQGALNIYEGLLGLAPLGSGFKWRAIAWAAVFAMIGPTAWALVHKPQPHPLLAVALAVMFIVLLLKIGDSESYEFIYFQF
ncbi:MAG: MBOAT family protein [Chelatococcus sp.]|uniref:MBOAT family O-acyltransferase n=1 Tax=Chelatococcus sp. TaxID=1953771 RepID=UPI0025C6DB7A|nr:MBOAT family O-acyltransferase [Chelatococcus sp.]MBX3536095.1 MBOAT family protein [Chelatococcus sp.]